MSWICIGAVALSLGQEPLRFEVASIRDSSLSGSEGGRRERVDVTGTSVWMRNVSLKFAIEWAYGLKFFQVTGPGWLNGDRYDIQAKTQDPHSAQEFREMMQRLLADRFKVASHKEIQPRPVYVLERGKGALQCKPAAAEDASSLRVENGDFVFSATTMGEFALRLSDFATMDRPVVDRTGIAGRFDCRLAGAASAIRGGDGPSIFTAVAESGLRLRPANEPIEILIVDRAEKQPTSN